MSLLDPKEWGEHLSGSTVMKETMLNYKHIYIYKTYIYIHYDEHQLDAQVVVEPEPMVMLGQVAGWKELTDPMDLM